MRALVADGPGGPEALALREVPVPRPGPGQILVRIRAAAVNPADLKSLRPPGSSLKFPHVPGGDFAGTVVEAGEAVTRFTPGDEVFGFAFPREWSHVAGMVSTPPSHTTGGMAEYAVVEAGTPAIGLRRAGLTPELAAALPGAGCTATTLLRAGSFRASETVLVIGATGGVGSFLVPLLAAAGTKVLATASPADQSAVRDFGAAVVIDHRAVDPATEALRLHPDGVDALVDLAQSGDRLASSAQAVRPGGRVLAIASDPDDTAGRDDVSMRFVMTAIAPGDLAALADRAVEGILRPTLTRYSLDEAAQAYTDLRDRHTFGKLVVVP